MCMGAYSWDLGLNLSPRQPSTLANEFLECDLLVRFNRDGGTKFCD